MVKVCGPLETVPWDYELDAPKAPARRGSAPKAPAAALQYCARPMANLDVSSLTTIAARPIRPKGV